MANENKVPNLRNVEGIHRWLRARPPEVSLAMSVRVALRNFHLITSANMRPETDTIEAKRMIFLAAIYPCVLSWTLARINPSIPVQQLHPNPQELGGPMLELAGTIVPEINVLCEACNDAAEAASSFLLGNSSIADIGRDAICSTWRRDDPFIQGAASFNALADLNKIAEGNEAHHLVQMPLWHAPVDNVIEQKWKILKDWILTTGDAHLTSSVAWYEKRLFGSRGEVDTELALLGELNDFWHETSVADPSWAQRIIIQFPQIDEIVGEHLVPPQQFAPIEVEFAGGRIVRKKPSAVIAGPGMETVHSLLTREAEWLAERLSGQMPDAARIIAELKLELGANLRDANLFAVGYRVNVMEQIQKRVDESLLDDAAGIFAGFVSNLSLFVSQSSEWKAYLANALLIDQEQLKNSDAKTAISEILTELTNPDHKLLDESVTKPLEALNNALLDGQMYNPETMYGFYRSVANICQVVAELALGRDGSRASEFSEDVKNDLRAKSVKFVSGSILATAVAPMLYVSGILESIFGFLRPVLTALGLG